MTLPDEPTHGNIVTKKRHEGASHDDDCSVTTCHGAVCSESASQVSEVLVRVVPVEVVDTHDAQQRRAGIAVVGVVGGIPR